MRLGLSDVREIGNQWLMFAAMPSCIIRPYSTALLALLASTANHPSPTMLHRNKHAFLLLAYVYTLLRPAISVFAFVLPFASRRCIPNHARPTSKLQQASSGTAYVKVPDEDDTVIPFVDPETNSFIDCYADSIVTLPDGITYTVGEPCDYAVALGYVDEREGGLVPLELDDPMMDDVFPVAELIIEEEFGEELSLQRTPQTLTLVGELEEVSACPACLTCMQCTSLPVSLNESCISMRRQFPCRKLTLA